LGAESRAVGTNVGTEHRAGQTPAPPQSAERTPGLAAPTAADPRVPARSI
jgi:hypothetical protein